MRWTETDDEPPVRSARRRQAEWTATILLAAGMLVVPAGFAVLLSAEGGEASEEPRAPAAPASTTRSQTDRSARVTFHLRPGSLGLRILRKAPASTRRLRGREVRVMCGSVSGLVVRKARWPRRKPTLRVGMPPGTHAAAEFCAVKLGRLARARVVFE